MSEVLTQNLSRRLPANAIEQIQLLPDVDERSRILTCLYNDIVNLLAKNGIKIDTERSSSRVKTDQRIQEKIFRRGWRDPILDIYGLRLIMENDFRSKAIEVIRTMYPTDDIFPWGKHSCRDYSNPEIRSDFSNKFNPNIGNDYTATHLNITFGEGPVLNIAEIQLRTPREHELAESTRAIYLAAQGMMIR